METIPERLEPEPRSFELTSVDVVAPDAVAIDHPPVTRVRTRRRPRAVAVSRTDVIALLAVYFATRGVLLLAAYLLSAFGHHNFLHELANWDGLWYREVANHGYLHHPSDGQTTLGFFPLYPLAIWALSQVVILLTVHDAVWSATVAGVLISTTGGAIATCLVYRLAADWWDRKVAFRAGVLFVLFPGSVVFSMVYSEGLLLPLAAGCLFALGRKRWLLAGVLAAFGTAVQPVGIVLVFVCAAAALIELRRTGWARRVLKKVIVAPALSLLGISAFAVFLWFWTGTPLANYRAQHHGWGEKTDPFALVHLTSKMVREMLGKVRARAVDRPQPRRRPGRRGRAGSDARARVLPAPQHPAGGARVDRRRQLPGTHLGIRAAQSEDADHRIPGADGGRPLRGGADLAAVVLDKRRAAGGAELVDLLRHDLTPVALARGRNGADDHGRCAVTKSRAPRRRTPDSRR